MIKLIKNDKKNDMEKGCTTDICHNTDRSSCPAYDECNYDYKAYCPSYDYCLTDLS